MASSVFARSVQVFFWILVVACALSLAAAIIRGIGAMMGPLDFD